MCLYFNRWCTFSAVLLSIVMLVAAIGVELSKNEASLLSVYESDPIIGVIAHKSKQYVLTNQEVPQKSATANTVGSFEDKTKEWQFFAKFGFPLVRDSALIKNLSSPLFIHHIVYDLEATGNRSSFYLGLDSGLGNESSIGINNTRKQSPSHITELAAIVLKGFDLFESLICRHESTKNTY